MLKERGGSVKTTWLGYNLSSRFWEGTIDVQASAGGRRPRADPGPDQDDPGGREVGHFRGHGGRHGHGVPEGGRQGRTLRPDPPGREPARHGRLRDLSSPPARGQEGPDRVRHRQGRSQGLHGGPGGGGRLLPREAHRPGGLALDREPVHEHRALEAARSHSQRRLNRVLSAAGTPLGHIALVHPDGERAEALAKVLRTAGHRVTVVPTGPGQRVVQRVIECSPDLLIGALALTDPPLATIARGVRQALGQDPPVLVLFQNDASEAPPETDEILREPAEVLELTVRVGQILRHQSQRRVLQRKTQELLGLYKMSWAFSLAGGALALYAHLSKQSAELLKAERGLVFLFDADRRQMVAQAPGFGITLEQVARARYSVDGEARSRWNSGRTGPSSRTRPRRTAGCSPRPCSTWGCNR